MKRTCWLAGLAVVLTLSACGSAPAHSSTTSPASGSAHGGGAASHAAALPIVIGYQPAPDAPLFVAMQKHLFAQAGVKAKFVEFEAGPPMFAALKSGSIDVAGEGFGAYVTGLVRGVPQIGIAIEEDVSNSAGLVARNGSGITSVAGLKGKRVATFTGSGEYFALLQALAQNHLSVKDIQYKNLAPPAMLAAFKNGDVDAAWVWPPWDYQMVALGGKIITHDAPLGILEPATWVANTRWAGTHAKTINRFLHGIELGLQFAKAHPQQAAASMATVMHVSRQVAANVRQHTGYPDVATQLSGSYSLSFTKGYQKCDGGFAAAVAHYIAIARAAGIYKSAPASCHQEFTPKYLKAYAG